MRCLANGGTLNGVPWSGGGSSCILWLHSRVQLVYDQSHAVSSKILKIPHQCMFAPKKHSKMCKLHGLVSPKRMEMKTPPAACAIASARKQNQTNPDQPEGRVHTCPKWTVIGLRSSRSLGSLASTSGDGAVLGSCSSMVGAQPFSAMSCGKPMGGDMVSGSWHLLWAQVLPPTPMLTGLPWNSLCYI